MEEAGLWGFVGGNAAGRKPTWVRDGERIAIGTARLDHPSDGGRQGPNRSLLATDLARILHAWTRMGRDAASLLGDFAYVMHDGEHRSTAGVRDVFGVDTLYYRTFPGFVAFASRADVLALDNAYDSAYFAEYLGRVSNAPRTPYSDVFAVPAAHVAQWTNGTLVLRRYWSGESFTAPNTSASPVLVDEFRERFNDAVRTRLLPYAPTWAQLSGGLDSSSVVSTAQS
ncbi:MAG: asparagine synthase-related protein, partial [Pseudomonadota bacterium]